MMTEVDKWTVTLVSWDDYLEIMLEGSVGERWPVVQSEMDLIVGGLNYEGDFMYVIQTIKF